MRKNTSLENINKYSELGKKKKKEEEQEGMGQNSYIPDPPVLLADSPPQ